MKNRRAFLVLAILPIALGIVGCSALTFTTEFVQQDPGTWQPTAYVFEHTYEFQCASYSLKVGAPSWYWGLDGIPIIPIVPRWWGKGDKLFIHLEITPKDSTSGKREQLSRMPQGILDMPSPKVALITKSGEQLLYPKNCYNMRNDIERLRQEDSYYRDGDSTKKKVPPHMLTNLT